MELDIGKALREGFIVLRDNPVIFVPAIIAALLSGLLNVYYTNISAAFGPEYFSNVVAGNLMLKTIEFLWAFAPVLVVSSLVFLYINAVIIRMVYDAKTGKVSLSSAARLALSKYITLFIGSAIYLVLVVIGLVALIIPGIYLSVKWVFYNYAILLDNEGARNSLKKSGEITKNNWWRMLALIIIFSLFSFIFLLIPESLVLARNFLMTVVLMTWGYSSIVGAYLQLKGGK